MNCPKCGSPVIQGSAFCTNCGTPLPQEQAPAQQPVMPSPVIPPQQNAPAQPSYQPMQQPMQQPQGVAPQPMPYGQQTAQPPKKKSKAGMIILIVALCLVVMGVVAGVVTALLRANIVTKPDLPTAPSVVSETQPTATDTFDVAHHIKGAVLFSASLVDPDSFNYDKVYTETIEDAYGGYEAEFYLYDVNGVKSLEDLKKIGAAYYTEQAIDNYFSTDYVRYHEQDDGLYIYVDGLGDASSDLYLLYEQGSDTEYTVTDYWFSGPYVQMTPFTLQYNETAATWQFDNVLPFYDNYAEIYAADSAEGNGVKVAVAYCEVMQIYDENSGWEDAFAGYGLIDIDGDGIMELIVETGETQETRYRYYYGLSGDKAVLLGSEYAGNSDVGSYDGHLVTEYGNGDDYRFYEYTIENGRIVSHENVDIISKDVEWVSEYNYWDTDYLHSTLVKQAKE